MKDSGVRVDIFGRAARRMHGMWLMSRFPGDRKGAVTIGFASKVSDSLWHREVSELAVDSEDEKGLIGSSRLRPTRLIIRTFRKLCQGW